MKTQNLLPLSILAGIVAVSGLVATTNVYAAPSAAEIEARFKAADKDGDGKLTRDEAEAGMPRIAQRFDQIDTEKKSYLTLDEIKAVLTR